MEEQLTRQKQVLREATAKYQNLIRHLKLIEAESGRIMYDETNVAHVHSKEDLQRLVDLIIMYNKTQCANVPETILLSFLQRCVCSGASSPRERSFR